MLQTLTSAAVAQADAVLCSYQNSTSRLQIARISNIPNWYFERVVFPGQQLLFEAPIAGNLEIHTGALASAILADTISCGHLRVKASAMDESE